MTAHECGTSVSFERCVCRSDTTQRVLEAAKRRLLDAIPKLSPAQLISLLEASFAYIGKQSVSSSTSGHIYVHTLQTAFPGPAKVHASSLTSGRHALYALIAYRMIGIGIFYSISLISLLCSKLSICFVSCQRYCSCYPMLAWLLSLSFTLDKHCPVGQA